LPPHPLLGKCCGKHPPHFLGCEIDEFDEFSQFTQGRPTMTLRIELATPEQAHLVHQAMRDAYAEYDGTLIPPSGALRETIADVQQAMTKGGALLAWDDGEVVGSARFETYPDYLYIGRVGVTPAYRGKGVGSALMRRIEEIARERGFRQIQLIVRMSLPENLDFYRHLGYEVTKTEPHPTGEAMVAYMGKQL
jgi:ribosomal protein S18 acetylase RimI-like enzyme